jgi:hypothetical protein
MAKKWAGTETHNLPAQQKEPYRLWFEFLKLALKDSSIKVDKKKYVAWGDIEHIKFDEWWDTKWQELFAVDIGVYEISNIDEFNKSENEIIVRIPLYQTPKKSLDQISTILKSHNATGKLKHIPSGQFQLYVGKKPNGEIIHPSTRFLRNLDKIRMYLNIYKFWCNHDGMVKRKRLEQITVDYFLWADGWNRKVTNKKWNRNKIEVPTSIRNYAEYLLERGDKKQLRLRENTKQLDMDQRRQVDRYLTKAIRIATNVSKGMFPAKYE